MNPETILAFVQPADIDLLSRIIESYDNLGVVSTLDQLMGKVLIRVTGDTYPEVMDILNHLPIDITLMAENS